jgi:MFS family permease
VFERSRLLSLVPAAWRGSATLAPFKSRIFASLWAASLVSNFGGLIESVGAAWLMTSLAPSPAMVALVQASTSLPIMLLSLPAGAVADIFDRRLIMLVAQIFLLFASGTLTTFAFMGRITPWTLLTLTFLIGCGAALYAPAWQSSVGEQVPRSDLSAAVSLNSLAFNLARIAGPAIGGVIVAAAGARAAFLSNLLCYIALIAVLATWRRPKPERLLPPERIPMAVGAGLRYARLSPGIRTVLVRGSVFGLLGSAIWALLPLIARDLIGGGAATFGVLYAAFGAGAVVGALFSASLRTEHGNEKVARVATVGFGVGTVLTAISSWHALSMLALMLAGASWVVALSTFNVTVQTASPRWVVGRTIAIYQMVTFGGLAAGSWLWGNVAGELNVVASLVISGSLMAISALLGLKLPLPQPEGLNLDPSRTLSPDQGTDFARLSDSGPIVVTIEYRISAADTEAFLAEMRELRRIRRRDGARRWTLMQDTENHEAWIERYHSPNWIEHLRRHHRQTVADQEVERRVLAFHRGAAPPQVRHLFERHPDTAGEPMAITDPRLPSGPAAARG